MRIVFDLDGVLRDLCTYMQDRLGVPYPQEWFWTHEGKTIYEFIKEDGYKALVYAPATDLLLPLVRSGYPIELWTNQPEHWRPYTELWIKNNLPEAVVRYLTTQEKQKCLALEPDTLLVDDCPNFTDFSRVLLYSQPYNTRCDAVRRITDKQDFLFYLSQAMNDIQQCKISKQP